VTGQDEEWMARDRGEKDSRERHPGLLRERRIPEEDRIFQPTVPNRRGELFAWISALGMVIVFGVVFARSGRVPVFPLLLLLGFWSAALMISFSNWMDIRTQVSVSPAGVHYRSPVRDVPLDWGQVCELRAVRVGGSWRITVEGEGAGFHFRTATVLGANTARPFRYGFPEGELLVSLILGGASLTEISRGGDTWICRRAGRRG
jgi:hypothetical protein